MTLSEWLIRYDRMHIRHITESGCIILVGIGSYEIDGRSHLFDLTDYAVSGVRAGSIYLVPKAKPRYCAGCGETIDSPGHSGCKA